jgi:hypothetical protein
MKDSSVVGRKPMVYFNDVQVGHIFPEYEFVITEEIADKYMGSIQEKNEYFLTKNEEGKRPVPPTISALFTIGAYKRYIDNPPGGIHAKQRYEFYQSLYIGDVLVIQAKIIDKYIKNDRKYVIIKTEVKKNNKIAVVSLMTLIWAG